MSPSLLVSVLKSGVSGELTTSCNGETKSNRQLVKKGSGAAFQIPVSGYEKFRGFYPKK
jgi:hypothetical protein